MKRLVLILLILLAINSAKSQNALNFDGFDDYVQTTYAGISGTNPRTVEAWINTPFVSGQEVITDWGSSVTGGRFTFNLINGFLRVEVQGSGVTSTTYIADTSWHHVAVTFNNDSALKYRVFIDGALENTFNIPTPINTQLSVGMRIGTRVDGANSWSGMIDEVRVWDYNLTQAQLVSSMNDEFCSLPSGMVAYHKLNEGMANGNNSTVTISPDLSSNSNDGTLLNFGLTGISSNWVTGYPLAIGLITSTVLDTGCGGYTSPSGNFVWDSSGIYMDTIQSAMGCDSIMTIDLTILENSYDTISASECDSLVSPSGNYTWYSTGSYNDTIPAVSGCDSVLTINLSIVEVDTSVNVLGNTLTSGQIGARYQWLDCTNNFSPLAGDTLEFLTITQSGTYAVAVNVNGCIDTSLCYLVFYVNALDPFNSIQANVYPNPSTGKIYIDLKERSEVVKIELLNYTGATLQTKTFFNSKNILFDLDQPSGMYIIRISSKDQTQIIKVAKE